MSVNDGKEDIFVLFNEKKNKLDCSPHKALS